MRSDYESDYFDYDWVDPELNRFMAAVKPEVRDFFNWLVRKEGIDQAKHTFNQCLAELVVRFGITAATKALSGSKTMN